MLCAAAAISSPRLVSVADFCLGLLFIGKIACASNQCYLGSIPFSTDVIDFAQLDFGIRSPSHSHAPRFHWRFVLIAVLTDPNDWGRMAGMSRKMPGLGELVAAKAVQGSRRIAACSSQPYFMLGYAMFMPKNPSALRNPVCLTWCHGDDIAACAVFATQPVLGSPGSTKCKHPSFL